MIDPELLTDKQLFFGLSDQQLAKIAQVATRREFLAGETLFREGSVADTLVVILGGSVDLFKEKKDGSRLNLARLGPGSVIGEMSLINIEPRSATAQAAVPVDAAIMENLTLAELFKEDRELFVVVLMNITRILSKRLRQANKTLA